MDAVLIEYIFVPGEIVAKHPASVVPQVGTHVAFNGQVHEVRGVCYVAEPLDSPQRVCVALVP